MPVVVDRPFDGSQDLGHLLPLVEQDGFVPSAQRGVGVGAERGRLRRSVEYQDYPPMSTKIPQPSMYHA